MLIFHQFKTIDKAAKFVAAIHKKYKLDGSIHTSQESSNCCDPFPYQLSKTIALVERPDKGAGIETALEQEIVSVAPDFGGEFAGT